MDDFVVFSDNETDPYKRLIIGAQPRDKFIQIVISFAFGLTAFLTFCVLRPRWTGLYAARKKQKDEAAALPELPASLFGWILPLWRITDQQVLASAGLDAYAFLAFFKMAIKFLVVTLFFSLIVIKPVHDANPDDEVTHPNKTHHHNHSGNNDLFANRPVLLTSNGTQNDTHDGTSPWYLEDADYLWMYVVFAYLFSAIAIYLIISETRRIIEVRQEYLGTQTSVTDRTIRLSGIPIDLRDEERLKEFLETLDIGKVERVTLCRNWKELDQAVTGRMDTLRRLEEAYTVYSGRRRVERSRESLPTAQPTPPSPRGSSASDEADDEHAALMGVNDQSHGVPYERTRPRTNLRSGFMGWQSKEVDAIDYYEEKLRQADLEIKELRQKRFDPMPIAFVTMDSVAACQMAIQAVLDPSPLHLIANPSPAPADVVWPNTYLSRRDRMIRAWSVTALIIFLTLFWSIILVPIAGLLNPNTVSKVFPQVPEFLKQHKNIRSLVSTQLPTLIASLLVVLVPYLYYWLSWYQGMISAGDVELSAISKNFFFTFFNFFVFFTVVGTVARFLDILKGIGEPLGDIRETASLIANSLQGLLEFYINFIILQGLGLFPFRLLQFGSVSTYPMYRIGAKTPRDYAELVQPPTFNYGFYLPNALLIFIICIVYSVLRSSWQVLLAGLIYFAFGHFVYKYQLLYAMHHQQQATGRAWVMICDRIFVGLVFFQLATSGQLILKGAVTRSALIIPLVAVTIWMSIAYGTTYKPLMKFIALRSVKQGEQYADADEDSTPDATSTSSNDFAPERRVWAETNDPQLEYFRDSRTGAADKAGKNDMKFMNPSLIAPLEGVWIADRDSTTDGVGSMTNAHGSDIA